MQVNENDCILEIKTVQSSIIKTLIESLKELLCESPISFSPEGIKILTAEKTKQIIVHMNLDGTKFQTFFCPSNITICVNWLHIHRIVKSINGNDTLTLFIKDNNRSKLGICFENSESQSCTTTMYKLIDLENVEYEPPEAKFNSMINFQSCEFQRICRNMSTFSETIEIKTFQNQLILSCNGEYCDQEIIRTNIKDDEKTDDEVIFQGIFNLKTLCLFTKCTNLSNSVELHLRNDYPLVVRYNIVSLGEIKLCLGQCG
jgi:proliferating cell nuclear antigen